MCKVFKKALLIPKIVGMSSIIYAAMAIQIVKKGKNVKKS